MRFQVPQFIEIEDKIFGPLTFKQFVYLAGGGGICVAIFYLLPRFIAIILIMPVAVLALALTFYKVNNKPFVNMLEAVFGYVFNSKLYIWKKEQKEPRAKKKKEASEPLVLPQLSASKLKELTWTLGVSESQNPLTPPR